MADGFLNVAVTSWDTLKFSWWENSQSVANNITNVGWKIELIAGSSGKINSSASKPWSVTVDGENYSGTTTIGISNNTTKVLASGTTDIKHDSDGTKTFTFSFSQTINITFSGSWIGTKSGSGSGKLTTIPRATQPVIYTSNIDMGKNMTIDLPRASTSFAHVVRYTFAGGSGYISGYATDTVNWVIPLTLANSIPNATSGVLYIYCDTYNGETLIGTKSVSLIINVPSNIIPTVTIATSDPTGFKNKYGAFVQGKSKFKTDVSALGVYGSTIKSYKVTADGKTYTTNPVTTDVISGSGELTITATATDSRNRASAVSGKVNVLPYVSPKINSMSVYRCNEDGERANGGYLAVVISAEITALNNKNSAVYSIQYKKNTETEYTTEEITDFSGQYTISNGVFVFAADTSSSYNIILNVSDDFSSVERTATGSSIKKLWSILKKGFGFAFGKIAELANTLEVALKAVFYEDVHIKGALTYDIPISHNDADAMLTSGKFYLGIDAKNRPVELNGWLEVFGYSENHCHHKFTTYTGEKYERWKIDGVWGEWSFVDYIVESGTSGIWKYEKRASGIVECWGLPTVSITAQGTYALVVYAGYVDIPDWITSVEYINSCCTSWNLANGRAVTSGTNKITVSVFVPKEVTVTQESFYIKIKGRWK